MTLIAPTLQTFFSDRLVSSSTRAPGRSPPIATCSGCCSLRAAPPANHPSALDWDELDEPALRV